jgi:hypothetical protein
VSSVCGLHRVFPPPDPPVYSRPQLKPHCGICLFTTTTFGAHRGADSSAGRITSGRDLLRQLGGSTSTSPPSTSLLLHLPGPTSTRPGQHSVVPDLHRHSWADIFFPGPAYACPGRHWWVPTGISLSRLTAGVDFGTPPAGIRLFWLTFMPTGRHKPISAFPGRNSRFLGRFISNPAPTRASSLGWAGCSFVPAGPSRPLCGCSARPSWPPLWVASAGCLMRHGVDDVNHRPVGDPKRKV